MAYHGFALQEAIYSALNVSSLNNLVTGVFDTVPDDTTLPVVIIGSQTTNDGATKDLDGRDYIFNVDIYSNYRGMKETKTIEKEVYSLLHNQSISVSGASLVNCRCEFTTEIQEDDGVTRHAVMRFRAFVMDS